MNSWQFHLSNLQRVGRVWAISVSFVYTGLLVWAYLQSHNLNLTYCLKSCLLLVLCFLFVCMIDQTQMYPSSISPLGLLQRIILCNIYSVNHLIYWGLGFLENRSRGDQEFIVKMERVAHIGGCLFTRR